MPQPIIQIDAFTDHPFAGNPAAVCVLPEEGDATWMQKVAVEMNLSETAFLVRTNDAFNLRWFTPAAEVDLCGHATLASAHALWTEGHLDANDIARFDTLSGRLEARLKGDWIEMDFPTEPVEALDAPPLLAQSLGATPTWSGRNRMDYFAVFATEAEVRALQPDFRTMRELGMRGVTATAPATDSSEFDFVSRFFAPRFGVDEDPVTGSAHCCLGPYWAQQLEQEEVVGFQASARGGVVRVRPEGDRVKLLGQAITVLRGTLEEAALANTAISSVPAPA